MPRVLPVKYIELRRAQLAATGASTMRYFLTVVSLVVLSRLATAGEPVPQSSNVDSTIARGLAFLAKDALAWKTEHHCASCHHAALVVWSMREAKQRGIAVDEQVLNEMTQWIANSGDGKTGVPRPEGIPKALNEKAVSYALGLESNPAPDAASVEGLKRLLATVQEDQLENGSWASWPETRPPMFGNSDERATIFATLALLPAADGGDETAKAARDKGIDWLIHTKADDDPQAVAMRLVLWRRLGRPVEECEPLVQRIRSRQNDDGGWSQTKEMTSDGWATGQALYALAHAGPGANDSAIQRGQQFLVKSQREDGAWPMSSRPTKPGGAGSTSLIPITGAGSAWAVIGLARSR